MINICDRCGKEYGGGGMIFERKSLSIKMDLCPKCTAGLMKWLENGKAVRNEQRFYQP